MTTGLHTVRDISCIKCNTVLGWTYVGITSFIISYIIIIIIAGIVVSIYN